MKQVERYASSSTALGAADPVAGAIGLLRPRVASDGGVHIDAVQAVRFASASHVKVGVVVRGECWLTLDGEQPVLLRQGDFYLLGEHPAYVLSSSLDARPRSLEAARAAASAEAAPGDDDTYVCGLDFFFDDRNASVLLDVLPPVVIARADDRRAQLFVHLSALIVAEIERAGAGSAFVIEHLAQIVLVHMLRAHAEQAVSPAGWLHALSDDGVGAALRAMHADVGHRWTLKELAAVARMSRSAFAATFKKKVGAAPLEYLIEWRMYLARDALCRNTRSISELAWATGYESESAFSTAFRRVVGSSPKHFRDAALQARADALEPGLPVML